MLPARLSPESLKWQNPALARCRSVQGSGGGVAAAIVVAVAAVVVIVVVIVVIVVVVVVVVWCGSASMN